MPKAFFYVLKTSLWRVNVYFGRGANENLASLWLATGWTELYFTNMENIEIAEMAKRSRMQLQSLW